MKPTFRSFLEPEEDLEETTAGMVCVREIVAGIVAVGESLGVGRSRGVNVMVMWLPEVVGIV
jgi:hypothetical protein